MARPTLSEMETRYETMLLITKENWPPSSMAITQLRELEFLIDSERSQQELPLRFHTAEQLAILLEPDMENQTDEGAYYARCSVLERHYLPTSAIEVLRRRPDSEPAVPESTEQMKTVTAHSRTTITLGALITQLQELEKTLGKNAPVWHVEMGGITKTGGAEAWKGGVVIE